MPAPLDESYFKWLYDQVAVSEFVDRDLTYWKVLKILFTKEFIWVVVNDENRSRDGIALRYRFLHECGIDINDVDRYWMDQACSVLELMIALAERIEFDTDQGRTYYWFWILMDNIGLSEYSDNKRFTRRLMDLIDDILNDVLDRRYDPSGRGGFFPLSNPRWNQLRRELWYQMNDYILERSLAG